MRKAYQKFTVKEPKWAWRKLSKSMNLPVAASLPEVLRFVIENQASRKGGSELSMAAAHCRNFDLADWWI